MSDKTVTFVFSINQTVTINALGLKGLVLARCDRGPYREYRVIWWSEGQRKDDWLLESELE